MELLEKIKQIDTRLEKNIREAKSIDELEQIRIEYLGRKGIINQILKTIGQVPPEERPKVGSLVNQLKQKISTWLQERKEALNNAALNRRGIDVTIRGRQIQLGRRHPIGQLIEDICSIFVALGFEIVDGPEIDTEYYNFEALNIPLEHPSRDDFDTFYIRDNILLRSQTSTIQGRVMENTRPPLRVIAPGKVYRPDAVDATHCFVFHQIEGFMVDEDIKFSDLKGVLEIFLKEIFGPQIKTRFSPHYFPFTEPSAEVDISCIICQQKGCRVCGGSGWLEILGSGMIDPAVFKAVGYEPDRYTGFAFGMGVERIAMLKYGIEDIRYFFENDLRFLRQF